MISELPFLVNCNSYSQEAEVNSSVRSNEEIGKFIQKGKKLVETYVVFQSHKKVTSLYFFWFFF